MISNSNVKGVGLVYSKNNWSDIINGMYYDLMGWSKNRHSQRDINIFKINKLYSNGTIDISMRDELLSMVDNNDNN